MGRCRNRARLGGLNLRESVQLGAGMISRGEVGLVSSEEFSGVVAMVLVTTLVTPPLLRWLFSLKDPKAASEKKAPDDVISRNEETN